MAVSVGVASSGAGSRHTPAARGSTRDLAPGTDPRAPSIKKGRPVSEAPLLLSVID